MTSICTTGFLPPMREIADKHNERWAAVRRERAFAEAALIEEIDIRETTGGALNKIRQKADEAKLQALREDLIEAEALRDTLADLDELGRELVAVADSELASVTEARRAALISAGIAERELPRALATAPDVMAATERKKQAREARASVYREPNLSRPNADQAVIDRQNNLIAYIAGRTGLSLQSIETPAPPANPLATKAIHGQWKVNGVPVTRKAPEPVTVFDSPDGE